MLVRSKTVERKQVSLTRGNPPLIKSNIEFLQLPLGKEILYFTPDAILVVAGDRVAALPYNDVEIVCRQTRFIEDDAAPSDAKVVGETWRYINRDGGPDRRFANNRKLPICLYGEIDFKSASGLNERIHCSRVDVSEEFASTTAAIRTTDVSTASNLLNSTSVERAEPYMNSLNPGYSVPLGASSAEGGIPLPIVLCVTCRSKEISSKKRLWQPNVITFVCNDCGTALEQVGDQYKLTHVADTGSSVWQKYAGKILYRREWANIAQGGYSDEELAIRWGSAVEKQTTGSKASEESCAPSMRTGSRNPLTYTLPEPLAAAVSVANDTEVDTMSPKERQLVQTARQQYVDTKLALFKSFNEAENLGDELASLRDVIVKNFDPLMERILCEIASADGPINALETEVLNILLGKQTIQAYYNELLKPRIETEKAFTAAIDFAIQVGGIEKGGEYDPANDPIVRCFETLGHAVVSADGKSSPRELRCLSNIRLLRTLRLLRWPEGYSTMAWPPITQASRLMKEAKSILLARPKRRRPR